MFETFLQWNYEVLVPNSAQKVINQQQFQTITAAVKRLDAEKIKRTDFTVFIPTDSALEAVGITKEAVEKMDVKYVRTLFNYIAVSTWVWGCPPGTRQAHIGGMHGLAAQHARQQLM